MTLNRGARRRLSGWIALTLLLAAGPVLGAEPAYDVIVRGGTIYDGSGAPGRRADLGIRGDRIVRIGDLGKARARLERDATGMAVAPGFTNMLSWSTESLLVDGSSQSDIRQGVTLEMLGEGETMGPQDAAMKQRQQKRLAEIGVDADWDSMGDYMTLLERRGVSPNIASFVGATNMRLQVLGYENRKATPDELARMQELVRRSMREGAFGITSALAYAPAMYADTDELIALAKAAAPFGGIYISHIRDEGGQLLRAVDELIEIAQKGGVAAEIYHLKAWGSANWPLQQQALRRIEQARAAGIRITADMYPYTAAASGLDLLMPGWVREGGPEAWYARMRDPALRARLADEIGRSPILASADGADSIRILKVRSDALRPVVGKSLAEVARSRGVTPAEAVIDLIAEDGSRIGVAFFVMSEENVRELIRQPWMAFSSDAESAATDNVRTGDSTHPRGFGAFARVLGKYVRDDKVISLPDAVRRLAALPAETLGIADRGKLQPGFFADVVVFDPATIADRSTFAEPRNYAVGMRDVFVNGVLVLRDGEHTGAKPGRFVRKQNKANKGART